MNLHSAVIAAAGMVLAAFLGTAGAQDDAPRAQRDIDVKPFLAQGFAQNPTQAILLQRMQANCPEETKRAVMVDKRAPLAWFGCWRERDGNVEIAFEDGDFVKLEHGSFTWLSEQGT